jgi:multisubunit Na+/H+ antiporter MnhE subunit
MHVARRFLVWWVVLLVFWMELVSTTDRQQILAGLICSAAAAVAAVLAHVAMDQRYALDVRWLRWFGTAVPSAVTDTLRLARLVLRPDLKGAAGRLRELRLPTEGRRRAGGRRALAVVVLGLAPGS